MPHSLEWVLAHADVLADEAEALDPANAERVDLDEYLLRRAARARALAERRVADAVAEARRHDVPWRTIGESLGVTAQSAQRRYAGVVAASRTERPTAVSGKKTSERNTIARPPKRASAPATGRSTRTAAASALSKSAPKREPGATAARPAAVTAAGRSAQRDRQADKLQEG